MTLGEKAAPVENGERPPQRGYPGLESGSAVAFLSSLHYQGRPFQGFPAPPRPPHLVFILRHLQHAPAEQRPVHARRRWPPHPRHLTVRSIFFRSSILSRPRLRHPRGPCFCLWKHRGQPIHATVREPCTSPAAAAKAFSAPHRAQNLLSVCATLPASALPPPRFPPLSVEAPRKYFLGLSGRVHAPLRFPRSVRKKYPK